MLRAIAAPLAGAGRDERVVSMLEALAISLDKLLLAGGSVTAILLNTPGTAPNAATVHDGYPMTKNGKAGMALGAAAAASSIGGLLGILILFLILPIARDVILSFAAPLLLKPNFVDRGRWLIERYVKFDDLVERIELALEKLDISLS